MKDKFPSNRPWKLTAIIAAAVVALGGIFAVIFTSCGGPKAYEGYLVCVKCGMAGKCLSSNAANAIDLTTNPEKHTLKCNKMADCIVSGFGIMIKQDDGKYRFYKFDSKGSAMALDNVIYVTKQPDNLLVVVKGTIKGDTMVITSIALK
jgi:hypothetical protein